MPQSGYPINAPNCEKCGQATSLLNVIARLGNTPTYRIFECQSCTTLQWVAERITGGRVIFEPGSEKAKSPEKVSRQSGKRKAGWIGCYERSGEVSAFVGWIVLSQVSGHRT